MTDSRKHMDPSTRTNKDMWDERDIQWVIGNPSYFEETSDSDSIQDEMQDPPFTRVVRQRTAHDPEQDDITTISSISSSSNRVVRRVGVGDLRFQVVVVVRSSSTRSSSSSSAFCGS